MNDITARQDRRTERLAVGLGWFSLALGVAELAAPRSVARLIGAPDDGATASVLRSYGARELANGLAILGNPGDSTWLWARVGGDTLDLACLGALMKSEDAEHRRTTLATAAVLGLTALDVLCAQRLSLQQRRSEAESNHVAVAITINQPLELVYAAWMNPEHLPPFMREAEVVESRLNETIAMRNGIICFAAAPAGRGTEIRVEIEYTPPAGRLGQRVAKALGLSPADEIMQDLRRIKQLMETGDIVVSDGPDLWRPAQPPSRPEEAAQFAGV